MRDREHRTLPRPSVLEWLCLAGGAFLVIHYSWIMDDAFVYFRYVDNLLFLGIGLVYNAGEYVEGCTSTLWVWTLALARLTRVDHWVLVRVLGVLFFALFWAGAVVVNRKLSPPGSRVVDAPLVLLCCNYGALCYFTSGLDTPMNQLAAVLYALYVLEPRSRVWQALVGLSPLLRLELVLPFAVCLAWTVLRRRFVPKVMLAVAAAGIGGWELFRIVYYADIFPSTFYLKDESNWAQGLRYAHDTLSVYHAYWIVPLLALALAAAGLRGREVARRMHVEERLVLAACVLPVALYVVRIGGDARHYRYLGFVYPLTLLLLAGGVEHALAPVRASLRSVVSPAIALGLAALTFFAYPQQLARHPAFDLLQENDQTELINDAAYHRTKFAADLDLRPWSGPRLTPVARYERYLSQHGELRYDGWITSAWCADHYLAFDQRAIQSLGLTDGILSRVRMRSARPSHKEGLRPLALDLERIQRAAPAAIGRGMFRKAVERGEYPPWVKKNLDTLELLERKIWNRHDLLENLRLACTFPDKMLPGPRREW